MKPLVDFRSASLKRKRGKKTSCNERIEGIAIVPGAFGALSSDETSLRFSLPFTLAPSPPSVMLVKNGGSKLLLAADTAFGLFGRYWWL